MSARHFRHGLPSCSNACSTALAIWSSRAFSWLYEMNASYRYARFAWPPGVAAGVAPGAGNFEASGAGQAPDVGCSPAAPRSATIRVLADQPAPPRGRCRPRRLQLASHRLVALAGPRSWHGCVGAVLAEQHDEWVIARLYTGAELAKDRLWIISGDPAEVTEHALTEVM